MASPRTSHRVRQEAVIGELMGRFGEEQLSEQCRLLGQIGSLRTDLGKASAKQEQQKLTHHGQLESARGEHALRLREQADSYEAEARVLLLSMAPEIHSAELAAAERQDGELLLRAALREAQAEARASGEAYRKQLAASAEYETAVRNLEAQLERQIALRAADRDARMSSRMSSGGGGGGGGGGGAAGVASPDDETGASESGGKWAQAEGVLRAENAALRSQLRVATTQLRSTGNALEEQSTLLTSQFGLRRSEALGTVMRLGRLHSLAVHFDEWSSSARRIAEQQRARARRVANLCETLRGDTMCAAFSRWRASPAVTCVGRPIAGTAQMLLKSSTTRLDALHTSAARLEELCVASSSQWETVYQTQQALASQLSRELEEARRLAAKECASSALAAHPPSALYGSRPLATSALAVRQLHEPLAHAGRRRESQWLAQWPRAMEQNSTRVASHLLLSGFAATPHRQPHRTLTDQLREVALATKMPRWLQESKSNASLGLYSPSPTVN